jgi:5-methylcytosine-specific restriction endonuclease McrA
LETTTEQLRPRTDAEKQAIRRAANRDRHNALRREWYYKNLDKARELRRRWAEKNKEKCRASWANRDARRKRAEGKHTTADIQRILKAQKCKCAVCRKSVRNEYHIDHIQPLSRGGTNWPRNLQILCPQCNHSKGPKNPETFMRQLGFLL